MRLMTLEHTFRSACDASTMTDEFDEGEHR